MHYNINNINYFKQKAMNLLQSAALLIGMVLVLSLLGWIFAGANGMLWAFFISIGILMISPNLSPRLILRLYSAKPLSPNRAPRLYSALKTLAQRAELPSLPTLYYVPTRTVNAFATGNRNNAAIAVTDGMLNALNMRELNSVLAHEVSHLKNNDLWILNLSNTISQVTSFFSLAGQFLLILNLPLLLLSGRHISWIAILMLISAPTITMLLQLALSRTREFSADLNAAILTGDPKGLASALLKIERHQAGWLPGMFFPGQRKTQASTFRTHPNTGERIKRLFALSENRQLIKPHTHPLPDMGSTSHTPVTIPIRHHFKRRYCGTSC
jgi:heat shock protein HtpX